MALIGFVLFSCLVTRTLSLSLFAICPHFGVVSSSPTLKEGRVERKREKKRKIEEVKSQQKGQRKDARKRARKHKDVG